MIKKPKTTRQQKRKSHTRQRLLDAAKGLFAEKGLDFTTIDNITERADVGKGTFYYHFKNKEGLLKVMISKVLGELIDMIKKEADGITDLSELLDMLVGIHIEFFSTRWEDFVLYFQGRADLKLKEGYSVLEEPFLAYLETIESLLDSIIKQQLPKHMAHRIACAIAGLVSGYYSFAVITADDEDVDKAFRSLRSAMVASLKRFISEALPQNKDK